MRKYCVRWAGTGFAAERKDRRWWGGENEYTDEFGAWWASLGEDEQESVADRLYDERAPKHTSRLSESSGFSQGEKWTGTTRLPVAGFREPVSADARRNLLMLQTTFSQSNH